LNYDSQLLKLAKPVLFTHGLADQIVLHRMSEYNLRLVPQARLSSYPQVGHAPFWEAPARFNAELLAFSASLPS
jgi:pimeloyl-ACP methyl ester carboxylesterase